MVQYTNNDYYLTHSFDKTENQNGWIFMDFANNPQNNLSLYEIIPSINIVYNYEIGKDQININVLIY